MSDPLAGTVQLVSDLGARQVRDLRERARLSQAELAAMLGVSPGLIRHWEGGRKAIPPARQADLRRVFAGQSPAAIPPFPPAALRSAREAAAVTQAGLAQMLGVKQQAIAAWERDAVPEDRREVLAAAAAHPGGFVGGLLAAERRHAGIKQTELARAIAVPQSRISGWERGEQAIPVEQWPALRAALDASTPRRTQRPVTASEVREGRRRLGWSQRRLAEELGVATSVVGNWEAGARKPVPRERWTRVREVLRLSEAAYEEPRDRVGEALAGVLEQLAAAPGLSRSELAKAVAAPEPYIRAATARALAADLIHERVVNRPRADGRSRQARALFPGTASEQPPPVELMVELVEEVVAAVKADPGRTRRAIAEGLRHDRRRGEDATDRAIAAGRLHMREIVVRWLNGARSVTAVFPGRAPARTAAALAGEKVRRAREQLLMGQAELARGVGVSPPTLRRWERSAVPRAWVEHVEAALLPGEGSAKARAADARQRARAAWAAVARKVLATVEREPGIARWGSLARDLSPVERPYLAAVLEQLMAAGKLHERPSDNRHGTGLFPGPAPAEQAAAQLEAAELRRLRKAAGLRQADIARRIRAGVATVNGWEAGKPIPPHRQAQLRQLFAVLSERPAEPQGHLFAG